MLTETALIVHEESVPYVDRDGLWKKVITDLFEPFMLFFAPDLYEQLDWTKQPDSLEQEFKQTFPDAFLDKEGTTFKDKLMKVHLKNGEEQWILVHVEVQGDSESHFAERMFQYFYRIVDKYEQKIYAIALLTDPVHSFKPTSYDYHFHGTALTYAYNTYKILDQDEEKLLQSNNPFALVVLAGIYMLKSKKDVDRRYQFKRRLFDLILKNKNNFSRDHIQSLFSFIDFLLAVPSEMNQKLQQEITPMVEKKGVSIVNNTSFPDPPTLKPFIDQWRKEGKELGIVEEKKNIAETMLEKGFSDKEITELTGITEKELVELKDRI